MKITLDELSSEIKDCTGNTMSSAFHRFQRDPSALKITDRAAKGIVDQADYPSVHAYAQAVDHLFDTGHFRLYFVLRSSLLMHALILFYASNARNMNEVEDEIHHRIPGFVSHLSGYKHEGFFFASHPQNPFEALIPRNQQRQFLRKINPLSLSAVKQQKTIPSKKASDIGYLLERSATLLHGLGRSYSVNDPRLKKYFIASDQAKKIDHQYKATAKLLRVEHGRLKKLIKNLKRKRMF